MSQQDKPRHCFNCSTKINPDERMCNIDGHVFDETLGVLTSHRDKNCPYDLSEKEVENDRQY